MNILFMGLRFKPVYFTPPLGFSKLIQITSGNESTQICREQRGERDGYTNSRKKQDYDIIIIIRILISNRISLRRENVEDMQEKG